MTLVGIPRKKRKKCKEELRRLSTIISSSSASPSMGDLLQTDDGQRERGKRNTDTEGGIR